LKWTDGSVKEEFDCITAATPFGSYEITKSSEGLHWGYCFDEYYDEDRFPCDSVTDGKKAAWQNWVERIGAALEQVEVG
jgi:hypothetical protein